MIYILWFDESVRQPDAAGMPDRLRLIGPFGDTWDASYSGGNDGPVCKAVRAWIAEHNPQDDPRWQVVDLSEKDLAPSVSAPLLPSARLQRFYPSHGGALHAYLIIDVEAPDA